MSNTERGALGSAQGATYPRWISVLLLAASRHSENSTGPGNSWTYSARLLAYDAVGWAAIYMGLSTVISNLYGWADVVLPMLTALLSVGLIGGYNPRSKMASLRYATEHLIACACGLLGALIVVYVVASFGGGIAPSRGVLALAFVGFAGFSLFNRRYLWFTSDASSESRGLLVIGDQESSAQFHFVYAASGLRQELHFVATDPGLVGRAIGGIGTPQFRTSIANLPEKLKHHPESSYEGIVMAVDSDKLDGSLLGVLTKVHFRDLPVYSLTAFYEAYWEKLPVHLLGPTWPLQVRFHLVRHSVFASMKRLMDVLIALLVLIVTAPLMLAVALAVKVSSPGPAIFRQTRVGQHEDQFTLYKFRTMFTGSEHKGIYTQDCDPRITPVGRWLRKTRLDELPQVFNVLRGDMSMIGPRAEWIKCVDRYQEVIPHYHFRHLVRPGITGWAQVNYPYGASDQDAAEKLAYDLYYIRNFSLTLDASVILKTLHVMFFGKGR